MSEVVAASRFRKYGRYALIIIGVVFVAVSVYLALAEPQTAGNDNKVAVVFMAGRGGAGIDEAVSQDRRITIAVSPDVMSTAYVQTVLKKGFEAAAQVYGITSNITGFSAEVSAQMAEVAVAQAMGAVAGARGVVVREGVFNQASLDSIFTKVKGGYVVWDKAQPDYKGKSYVIGGLVDLSNADMAQAQLEAFIERGPSGVLIVNHGDGYPLDAVLSRLEEEGAELVFVSRLGEKD